MINHIVEYKDKELLQFLKTKNYSTLLKLNYTPLLEYIEYNITMYTDDIVLLDQNTEEDIDAIVKLLELNADDKCRHIQIIENENLYVEDITEICLNIWEEHEEYVTSVWNTIIVKEKLRPSWENFYNYWCYLGHTDISIAYMCKHVEFLKKDDSTCINDEMFINEFLTADIDKECFAKLLPKLPWSDFNIQLSTLDESKISTMISQRYFTFNVDRYNELLEYFPSLSVEFIIHNQSEYMAVNDQITMDCNLLESLVCDKRFTRSNAQSLIEDYGTAYMTSKIARNLKSMKVNINIDLFEAAWKLLDQNEKESFMLDNVDLLNADKFKTCFSELGGQYTNLSNRSRRHQVFLTDTSENLKLAQRLNDIGYITSFQKKENKEFDSVKSDDKIMYRIVCRIKPIS